jgi:hypothetical protein
VRTTARAAPATIYAVSLPSVVPSSRITWFQAEEACANAASACRRARSGRSGANGTPDPGPTTGRPTATAALARWTARAHAVRACRRAERSTWWATSRSGWPTGCRSPRYA